MTDTLLFLIRTFMALGIVFVGARILLSRVKHPRRRLIQRAEPSGHGPSDLVRLLVASASSTYARDRVQARLRTLAADVRTLTQDGMPSKEIMGSRDPQEQLLADYLSEDHVGFKGGHRHRSNLDPDFLHRTEMVLRQLERHRQDSKGDHS